MDIFLDCGNILLDAKTTTTLKRVVKVFNYIGGDPYKALLNLEFM